MRKLLDTLICIAAAACMMSFPVLLLGLTPWFGEWVLHTSHASSGRTLASQLLAVVAMLCSSAGALLVGIPVFGLAIFGLIRAGGMQRDRPRMTRPRRAPVAPADDAAPDIRVHVSARRGAPAEDDVPIEVMKELARRARAARRNEPQVQGETRAPRRPAAERLGVPPR